MGKTLKDAVTPSMPTVRKHFPGVGGPGTLENETVKQVRKAARSKPKGRC